MTRLAKVGSVVGALMIFALSMSACGGDETLYKWDCARTDACAATKAEAEKLSRCATVDVSICDNTGETCVCPDGARSCNIRLE